MKFHFSAGGVVFKKDPDLKILLIKPEDPGRQGRWALPKGNIEKGEKVEDTALREVKEETGIDAEIVKKIDEIQYFFKADGHLIKKKVYFFLMKYVGGSTAPQPGETEEVGWFDAYKAVDEIFYKTEKEVLQKALKVINS